MLFKCQNTVLKNSKEIFSDNVENPIFIGVKTIALHNSNYPFMLKCKMLMTLTFWSNKNLTCPCYT